MKFNNNELSEKETIVQKKEENQKIKNEKSNDIINDLSSNILLEEINDDNNSNNNSDNVNNKKEKYEMEDNDDEDIIILDDDSSENINMSSSSNTPKQIDKFEIEDRKRNRNSGNLSDEDFENPFEKRRNSISSQNIQNNYSSIQPNADEFVDCPLCSQRVRVRRLNQHIDLNCPKEEAREEATLNFLNALKKIDNNHPSYNNYGRKSSSRSPISSKTGYNILGNRSTTGNSNRIFVNDKLRRSSINNKPKKLGSVAYHLLSEKQLRKLLKVKKKKINSFSF